VNVLVTGAAGFIGSHLACRLAALGHRVRAMDDLSTGRMENLAPVLDVIELLSGDVANAAACQDAVCGMDAVFHHAAVPSVPRSTADPMRTHRANVDGTLTLLEACRGAGVHRIVYAASSSAYGNPPAGPTSEGTPVNPLSLYALQKLAGEMYGHLYSRLFGVAVVGLRYFNVFGPRQDPQSEYSAVIPRFTAMMLRGERPTVFGDGQSTRDYVYVDNAVDANLLALEAEGVVGRSVNIGSGVGVSLIQLVERLNRILGTDLAPVLLPERPGDVRHSQADIGLARRLLGYVPRVDLDEGLRRTVASLRTAPGSSGSEPGR
jgi:UDP-N-acetylglucosamine/UDP-N-acetyl-alpha-D-glucosaminouronate 4-epimerase